MIQTVFHRTPQQAQVATAPLALFHAAVVAAIFAD